MTYNAQRTATLLKARPTPTPTTTTTTTPISHPRAQPGHPLSPIPLIYTTAIRHTQFSKKKGEFSKEHGRDKLKYKTFARRQMYKKWNVENLVRLHGELRGQRSQRRMAKYHNRRRFNINWLTTHMLKGLKQHEKMRTWKKNWNERYDYDPVFRALPEDELGPDAVHKYKDSPFHLKFKHFAIHPRPIESNLVTGNEKVADKVLPPDFMDKIFNQPGAGQTVQERFKLANHKLHYDIHDFKRMGLKQRIVARLFHVGMPRLAEPLDVPNGTRRRLLGSNEIWVSGVWVDRREINDFLTMVLVYSVGLMTIQLLRLRIEAERLQGVTITAKEAFIKVPMLEKSRIIMDSDRTKRPQFELVEPTPRNPLLD